MELLLEAARALGLIVATIVVVLLAPLVFMVIFSLVTGFDDRVEPLERSARDE
jgi:ABC-type spermidine/putrescine transport system permease subunit II